MSVTGAIIAGVGAAGSLGGAAIASSGAGHAADTQAVAAERAAQLQFEEAQNALNFQQGVYGNEQQEIAPFLNTGYGALANLGYLAGVIPGPQVPGGATTPTDTNTPFTQWARGGGTVRPSAPTDPFAKYQNISLGDLGQFAGDPNVSPNAQTTKAWQQQGIPYKNINGVAVRTDLIGQQAASTPPSPGASGINIPSDPSALVNPSLGASGSLLQPFVAPTGVTEQNDPGYQFRLQQGEDAIERSAAARGGLLSTGTAKSLNDWAQGTASQEYGNVYNRAFNTFETNQANTWNRLAALAGIGQTAVNTSTNAGTSAAGNVSNIDLNTGAQVGANINAAGAARGSGYLNQGNIWGNAFGGSTNSLLNLYLLSQSGLFPGGGGGIPQLDPNSALGGTVTG